MNKGFLIALTILAMPVIAESVNLDGNADTQPLRVASYNIMASRMGSTAAISEAIKELNADIIGLQEVDNKTTRTIKNFAPSGTKAINTQPINQLQYIADTLNLYSHFCKAIDFDGGTYGHGILAKYPLKLIQQINLPNKAANEQRSACAFEVNIPSYPAPIIAISTHLEHADPELRLAQVRVIMAHFSAWELSHGLVVLIGDLNLTPKSKEYAELVQWFNDTDSHSKYTAPSWNPDRKIDYILTSTAQKWSIEHVSVPAATAKVGEKYWYQISDHLPFSVDMKLLEK